MATSVSQREFGRQVKRSHTWVQNQIKAGKIPQNADGTIPLQEGLEAFARYLDETGQSEPLPEGAEALEVYNGAKAKKEKHLAEIKEIEARVMRGQFVSIEEVQADARDVAGRLRSFCVSAPSRFAGLLEGRTQREAEAVLQDMFSELLERIHSGRFLREEDSEWESGLTAGQDTAAPCQD